MDVDKKKILKEISLGNIGRENKKSTIDEIVYDLFDMARWHGIEDYLLEYILENRDKFQNNVDINLLEDETINKSIIIYRKLKELCRIVAILEKEHINFAVIKGFGTLFWMKTQNENIKAYSDFDILVQKEQLGKAKQLLKSIGYVQMESENKSMLREHMVWHTSPLQKKPFFMVELHHRFTQIYDKHNFDVTEALENRVMATVKNVSFPTLNLEDSIYLLALHLYQHEYKDITFQLRHHAEIVSIILEHEADINWEKFVAKVIENNAFFPITYAFYHINLVYRELLGRDCIPEIVLKRIQPDDFIEKKDMLSHRHMFMEEPFGNWDFQTFHWKYKYGKEWEGGYEERLFGDMKDVTLRYYYLFFRHYADENWKCECKKLGLEYEADLFF